MRSCGGTLLTAADASPAGLRIGLPDLASRLSWGLTCHLEPLGDSDKRQLLRNGAARRGMVMEEETASYILRHSSRDAASLISLLEHLDRASLEAQRRLTLPFVREQIKRRGENQGT